MLNINLLKKNYFMHNNMDYLNKYNDYFLLLLLLLLLLLYDFYNILNVTVINLK